MTLGEARAVNAVLVWLLGVDPPDGVHFPVDITEGLAKARAAMLADRARLAMGKGITGAQVLNAWPTFYRLAPGDSLRVRSDEEVAP